MERLGRLATFGCVIALLLLSIAAVIASGGLVFVAWEWATK